MVAKRLDFGIAMCYKLGRLCGRSSKTSKPHLTAEELSARADTASGKEVIGLMRCALCNEHIDDVELQFGDAVEFDEEYWHTECYAEYFELELDFV